MASTNATNTNATTIPAATIKQKSGNIAAAASIGGPSNGHQLAYPKVENVPNANTFAQNAALGPFAASPSGGLTSFAHFPISAQEILKRASENANVSAGSPAWEAAREQVLKSMIVSNHTLPASSTPRARGRGRGGGSAPRTQTGPRAQTPTTSAANGGAAVAATQAAATAPTSTPVRRGRGRPRGSAPRGAKKGRAGGRGRKRRRDDDEETEDSPSEPEDEESDDSNSHTPLTTITKSGRSITKPVQFNPVPDASPDGEHKRRRSYRRGPEFQLCAKCQRGHSPPSNVIVFCDGCSSAYHQWCHEPHIPREVVDVAEKEWFCGKCLHKREMESLPLEKRVSGERMTPDEKRAYLFALSIPTLVSLLLRATELHPTLPIFEPPPPSNNYFIAKSTPAPINGAAGLPTASSAANLPATSTSIKTTDPQQNHEFSTVPPEPDEDPYPDYSNPAADPPATYPRPGHGPIKIRPLTDPDDMPWLLDNNTEVFSHLINDGAGNLVPVHAHADASEAWGDVEQGDEGEGQEEFVDAEEEADGGDMGVDVDGLDVDDDGVGIVDLSDEVDIDGDGDMDAVYDGLPAIDPMQLV